MAIENATYINQLNGRYPRDADLIKEGAAHMRLIKDVLRYTFTNITGEVSATQATLNDIATKTYVDDLIANRFDVTYPVGSVYFCMDAISPATKFGGVWSLLTGDASITFGDGTLQDGILSGDNAPVVPLPDHSHTINHDHPNTRFATNTDTHNHAQQSSTVTTSSPFQSSIDPQSGSSPSGRLGGTTASDSHAHYVDVNLPAYNGTSGSAGTAGATLDVRGSRISINVWHRVS